MISLSKILYNLLTEKLTFNQLIKYSDPKRKEKSKRMRTRSLPMKSSATDEFWNFTYKSDPSHITTGKGYQGRITFGKNLADKSAIDLPCSVDCGCPDYKFKWAYANNDKDSSPMGSNSLNKCNGSTPNMTNPYLTPGLCKHLLSLQTYLKTKLEESVKPTLQEKLDEIVLRYPNSTIEVEE